MKRRAKQTPSLFRGFPLRFLLHSVRYCSCLGSGYRSYRVCSPPSSSTSVMSNSGSLSPSLPSSLLLAVSLLLCTFSLESGLPEKPLLSESFKATRGICVPFCLCLDRDLLLLLLNESSLWEFELSNEPSDLSSRATIVGFVALTCFGDFTLLFRFALLTLLLDGDCLGDVSNVMKIGCCSSVLLPRRFVGEARALLGDVLDGGAANNNLAGLPEFRE